jgi:hypothetical protein
VPRNLSALYIWMPTRFAVSYWARDFRSPRGELWFAAHCRTAPAEIASMTQELLDEIGDERLHIPAVLELVESAPESSSLS